MLVGFVPALSLLLPPQLRTAAIVSGQTAASLRTPPPLLLAESVEALAGMNVAQLKAECAQRGLPVSGKKQELIDRLSQQFAPASRGRAAAAARSSRSSATAGATAGSAKLSAQAHSVSKGGPAVMIVESPAKCATIAKFAGSDYIVLASYGHVRALPSKPNSVRPNEAFAMEFELVNGAGTVLKNMGSALRSARALLLATDPDREGEAIAWHVQEALRERRLLREGLPVQRITFSEITPRAVQAALASPRQINLPLVRAQQARQAVDYLVGFTLSPCYGASCPAAAPPDGSSRWRSGLLWSGSTRLRDLNRASIGASRRGWRRRQQPRVRRRMQMRVRRMLAEVAVAVAAAAAVAVAAAVAAARRAAFWVS